MAINKQKMTAKPRIFGIKIYPFKLAQKYLNILVLCQAVNKGNLKHNFAKVPLCEPLFSKVARWNYATG